MNRKEARIAMLVGKKVTDYSPAFDYMYYDQEMDGIYLCFDRKGETEVKVRFDGVLKYDNYELYEEPKEPENDPDAERCYNINPSCLYWQKYDGKYEMARVFRGRLYKRVESARLLILKSVFENGKAIGRKFFEVNEKGEEI